MVFTDLGQTVVLNNPALRRNSQLLTVMKPQLQHQLQLLLLLMQLQLELLICRQPLIFGILQLNTQVEHQVRTTTLLRAVQISVKKITELVNKDLFSNQSVTLSMRRQKPNSGQRSERRLTLQSAVAECQMLRNF